MTSAEMYAQANAILDACQHEDRYRSEVKGGGHRWLVCTECWNRHVAARRAARKVELAEWKATFPTCQRCGKRPGGWIVGYEHYHLCGPCKRATVREHYQNLGAAGVMAIFATGSCVDTTGWANP